VAPTACARTERPYRQADPASFGGDGEVTLARPRHQPHAASFAPDDAERRRCEDRCATAFPCTVIAQVEASWGERRDVLLPLLDGMIDRDDVGDARRAMALCRAPMDSRGRSRCGDARRYCSHGRARSGRLPGGADYRLEWTFAGHGGNRYLSSGETHARLTALLERDGEGTDARLDPLIRHAPNFAAHAAG